ncbi:Holliday junction DNA helicase RuvB [Acetivibrio straminisolvens JCM 21531]|uniref:Holliday junction DNA helicase RuvB n=1 Tax=Acetivibrio straminisolvens JCM 21531 TaxID=1294263 RepID=W4V0P0_9FIRM|nr:Holliday junction DNA helicase RuvB [Acetivibrio straminisolvens JCM 21531]
MEDRLVGCKLNEEDLDEASLRPRKFGEYIGQAKVKENLMVLSKRQRRETRHWITYFFMARPDWVRQPLPA